MPLVIWISAAAPRCREVAEVQNDRPLQTRSRYTAAGSGRKPDDRALSDLVGELSTRSDEFRREWARHDVRFDNTGIKRLHHSEVGDIELCYEGLQVISDTDLTLYAYTADPGTRSAEHWPYSEAWRQPLLPRVRAPRLETAVSRR